MESSCTIHIGCNSPMGASKKKIKKRKRAATHISAQAFPLDLSLWFACHEDSYTLRPELTQNLGDFYGNNNYSSWLPLTFDIDFSATRFWGLW